MIVVDLTEDEVNQRIEYFLIEIDKTINTYNHPFKFRDDDEIVEMLNYLFKLSGSKLRISEVESDTIEPVFQLKPLNSEVHTSHSLYAYYHQFNRDVLALKDVLQAFKRLYRFKHRYQHLWGGD
jgi:hypothetical protein